LPCSFAPEEGQCQNEHEEMCECSVNHGDEGVIVVAADAIVDPDAVMVELVDAAGSGPKYRSHFLQWREVFST
jgi:hypothetical protein